MYVLKYKGKYCRYRSYSTCDLVDTPQQASLYTRRRDAQKRKDDGGYYAAGGPIMAKADLKIFFVRFTSTEQEVG